MIPRLPFPSALLAVVMAAACGGTVGGPGDPLDGDLLPLLDGMSAEQGQDGGLPDSILADGTAADSAPVIQPFAVALLPDTQYYSQSSTLIAHFKAQTQWIVANLAQQKIAFVSHLGDIVHDGATGTTNNQAAWTRASAAMGILDGKLSANPQGLVPYSVVIGNHDYNARAVKPAATQYLTHFGPSRYSGRSWYVGSSPNKLNHAQVFSAGGQQILHLGLEYHPTDAVIAWAQGILSARPTLPAMVTTHSYLSAGNPGPRRTAGDTPDSGGDNSGESLYRKLVEPFPQVFLVVCGHVCGNGRRVDQSALGRQIAQVLADFQCDPNGGNGWMELVEVRPADKLLVFSALSPTYKPGTTAGPDHSTNTAANFLVPYDLQDHQSYLGSTTVLHFRQGQDSGAGKYQGAQDTHLGNGNAGTILPGKAYGSASNLRIDGDADQEQGLLQFSAIIGTSQGQIPPGTTIRKAILTLTTEGVHSDSTHGARLHRMKQPWTEASTYNSLVKGVQLGAEAEKLYDADSDGLVATKGTRSLDVTTSIQAWVNGAPNHGWVLMSNGNNRWEFRSSDWSTLAERPLLTVVY